MFTVKDLGEPGWTKDTLTTEPLIDSVGIVAAGAGYKGGPAIVAQILGDEADKVALATLFASAPELAKAVREYLGRLEDRLNEARQIYQETAEKNWNPECCLPAIAAARSNLEAVAPLYSALAMAYGKDLSDKKKEA